MSRDYYMTPEDRARELNRFPPTSDPGGEYAAWTEFTAAVSELSAEIDRLEDLRRWRPMAEVPAASKSAPSVVYVLVRYRHNPLEVWTYTAINGRRWHDDVGHRISPENFGSREWSYIPGQEPEAES